VNFMTLDSGMVENGGTVHNFSFYFPLATCLLLSALISFIMWLLRR